MQSVNRQRMMYPQMHSEMGRLEEKLQARKSKGTSVAPSDFLKMHLGDDAEGHVAVIAKSASTPHLRTKSAPAMKIAKSVYSIAQRVDNAAQNLEWLIENRRKNPAARRGGQLDDGFAHSVGPGGVEEREVVEPAMFNSLPANPPDRKRPIAHKGLPVKAKEAPAEVAAKLPAAERDWSSVKAFGPVTRTDALRVAATFRHLDVDGDGTIEYDEFVAEAPRGLKKLMDTSHLDTAVGMRAQFDRIDRNRDGLLTLGEIVTSVFPGLDPSAKTDLIAFVRFTNAHIKVVEEIAIEQKNTPKLSKQAKQDLVDLFQLYDRDSSGYVSVGEILLEINGEKKDGEYQGTPDAVGQSDLTVMLAAYDVNHDSVLSLEEFVNLFSEHFAREG
jgi:Ca2+-binding EF-hand superfamily protein